MDQETIKLAKKFAEELYKEKDFFKRVKYMEYFMGQFVLHTQEKDVWKDIFRSINIDLARSCYDCTCTSCEEEEVELTEKEEYFAEKEEKYVEVLKIAKTFLAELYTGKDVIKRKEYLAMFMSQLVLTAGNKNILREIINSVLNELYSFEEEEDK